MAEATTIEEQKMAELQKARHASSASINPMSQAKEMLSFGKKVSQHWLILAGAALFDLFALIPLISVVFNFIWGAVLFLYFGPKNKKGGSELMKIGLPILLGSIVDSVVSVLPVNIGATLLRIALS